MYILSLIIRLYHVMRKHIIARGNNVNTVITNTVSASDKKAQYDERAKHLLSQKIILAHILVNTIDEFKGTKPEDVVSYIEGEPYIGAVPIEPGLTNISKPSSIDKSSNDKGSKIVGLNTENPEINEGMIRFDIIFYVRMKNGLSQIIVNIEIQKDDPTEYNILNRAIFYVSRMVSSQKQRDFMNSDFDNIKQVYSIWLCLNTNENSLNHIHLVNDSLIGNRKWKGNINIVNIVIIGITKEPPESSEQYELHRLLGVLLSNKLEVNTKLAIIKEEYQIPVNDELREDVNIMCNLGQGIEDEAIAIGESRGEARGIRGLVDILTELEMPADIIVDKIMQKFSLSEAKAREFLP